MKIGLELSVWKWRQNLSLGAILVDTTNGLLLLSQGTNSVDLLFPGLFYNYLHYAYRITDSFQLPVLNSPTMEKGNSRICFEKHL